MERDVVVFDMDGTLANLTHRKHLVQRPNPDWHAFYEECDKDAPNEWLFQLLGAMEARYDIHIVSARHVGLEAKTRAWLDKHLPIEWDPLPGCEGLKVKYTLHLVRESEQDYRPDTVLKKEWLDKFGWERILFVVDDRQKVVDMWRAEGIKCLQCDRWEEYKRSSGDKKWDYTAKTK